MFRKTVGLILGLIAAALIVEALARLFFPHWAPRTGSISMFWHHDPLLGWSHIPNSVGAFDSHGFESTVRINSKGFRDVERTYDRDESKYRIVVLGDSMVWGWGVQQEETFVALLEKQCPRIEALNLGVSGYGTDQELLLFRKEVVRYKPQFVVVVVMDNDFQTNVRKALFLGYEKPIFKFDNTGRAVLTNTPVPEPNAFVRLVSIPIRHSYVLNQAARAYEQVNLWQNSLSVSGSRPTNETKTFPANPEEGITSALLVEMQEEAERVNAKLILVLADRMGELGLRLEEFCRSKNIPTVRLDPVFPEDEAKKLHLPDGVHWSVLGHQRVANQLLRYVQHENLMTLPAVVLPLREALSSCQP